MVTCYDILYDVMKNRDRILLENEENIVAAGD